MLDRSSRDELITAAAPTALPGRRPALFFLGVGMTMAGLIWLAILESLGLRTQLRWVWIFFQAQLGKYIPGSVWQYHFHDSIL